MGHTPVKVMISSIRMQINGFPGKSFARAFSAENNKRDGISYLRGSSTRETRATLVPHPPPLDFSRRINKKLGKKRKLVRCPPPSPRWSTNLENNRRNGIGNCSSFFFFSISNFESWLPHRRLPFELRIAFNPSRSKRLLPSLRHIIS